MPNADDPATTQILAHYDALADQDPSVAGDRLVELVAELCLVAIANDRDLLATVIRAGVKRGRGEALLDVCRDAAQREQ